MVSQLASSLQSEIYVKKIDMTIAEWFKKFFQYFWIVFY